MVLTWDRSEDVWDENSNDCLIEDVISLTDILLYGSHTTQDMQLVCRQLLFSVTDTRTCNSVYGKNHQ